MLQDTDVKASNPKGASGPTKPSKGERGFGLDIHLAFVQMLPREQALELLRALPALTAELYARVDEPEQVPSARLTGPLLETGEVQTALRGWLSGGLVRVAEVGVRGYLKSSSGYTEWMPWRRNVVLHKGQEDQVALREGEKYILE